MRYGTVIPGLFLTRPNRFIALVETAEGVQTVHVKNTGRCRELLIPGARVLLQRAENPARKTAYDLISVWKGERLINMDAAAPNAVFAQWLREGGLGFVPSLVKPECTHGDSRFDFYFEREGRGCFAEVKGVTLEEGGVVRFPDAPTERGVKHLHGLSRCVAEGYEAYAVFVIQMRHVRYFAPAWEKHREFGLALQEAAAAGVHVLALDCDVTEHSLTIADAVPIDLSTPD